MYILRKLRRKTSNRIRANSLFECTVKITSREELLMTKRNLANNTEDQLMVLESNEGDQEQSALALKEYIKSVLLEEFTMADFAKIAEAINSQDRFQQHYGVIGLRKLLSKDDPPIEDVINFNLGPRLILFLQNEKEPHLQVL